MKSKCYIAWKRILGSLIPGGGDRRTCNIQKDNFLKSSRAVRPDGCSGAHSAQDDEHPTAVLAHPFSSAESSAFTRQRQKHAKVHHANVSMSAKTWVLCVQEWFLSSRDRLKKSRVLARATCECSSRAQRASHSPTARVLCTMHSATLQPALIKRSPSMVSQHAAGGGSGGGGSGAAAKRSA